MYCKIVFALTRLPKAHSDYVANLLPRVMDSCCLPNVRKSAAFSQRIVVGLNEPLHLGELWQNFDEGFKEIFTRQMLIGHL